MNVGIVTFYDHSNYGAVLQAYALQSAVTSLGHNAFHVDFEDSAPSDEIPANPFLKKIVEQKRVRDGHFAEFRKAHLSTRTLEQCLEDATTQYVVGSDQVWNPEITSADPRYFLSFASKENRHAYACSLGTISDTSWEAAYSEALNGFADLSVREESGAEQVFRMTGRQPEVVLDPTLLLARASWEQLVDKSAVPQRPYLLLIMVQNDMQLLNEWKRRAADQGKDLKLICASYFPPVGFDPWSGVSVDDWLNAVYHADEVATSSFHGLVFSLIFNKQFHVAGLGAGLEKRNNRLVELMSQFVLEADDSAEKAQSLLSKKREASFAYLRELFE